MINQNKNEFKKLFMLGTDLNRIHDPDAVMERILKEAREFCHADAGSIYIVKNNILQISYTQNETLKENNVVYKKCSLLINNDSIAGYCAFNGKHLLLNDVNNISSDAPYSFNSNFDKMTGYTTQSLLTIPMKGNRDRIIGVLQIINPLDQNGKKRKFNKKDIETIMLFAGIAAIALEKAQLTRSIILKLIKMAELHDPSETGAHVNRVAAYSTELYTAWAKQSGINEENLNKDKDIIRLASMVHDIGKVAISDLILKKPAKLTDDEFNIMKKHTIYGARIFESDSHNSELELAAADVTLNHHERWDGNGYPGFINILTEKPLPGYQLSNGLARGKKGEEIPLFGRIVSIADVFDALSSKRCYKEQWTLDQVTDFLERGAGSQFDPFMINIFLKNIKIMNSIFEEYSVSAS